MSLELIEQNAIGVNDSYLSTIGSTGKDLSFDASQVALLYSIANQCPLLGGNPVYQARSLYALIDPEADFDDALACVLEGYVVKNEEQNDEISITVYPNPTRGSEVYVVVRGLKQADRTFTIQVVDLRGLLVMEHRFTGANSVLDVNILAQGSYQWSVQQEGVRIAQGKFLKL